MTFKKMKPLGKDDKVHIGCLNCSTATRKINMRCKIWGEHDEIIKDGKRIYFSRGDEAYEKAPTLMKFELMARKEPDADWQYFHLTALYDELYQRQGKNHWPLVKSGMGYA